MSVRVALFFDGKNFYRSLDDYNPTLRVDYDLLAAWIVEQAGGAGGTYVGAYYYTGHKPSEYRRGPGERLGGFLTALDFQLGYFVKREPIVSRKTTCRRCRAERRYNTEKRVDVRLASEMIQYAAVDSYDVAVLLTGDQDFIPAVEAVQRLGKRVYIATWNRRGMSLELRLSCFGEINLAEGVALFGSDGTRVSRRQLARLDVRPTQAPEAATVTAVSTSSTTTVSSSTEVTVDATIPAVTPSAPSSLSDAEIQLLLDAVMADLRDAYTRFSSTGGHVSVWLFCNRWRSHHGAPETPEHREALLAILIELGRVEPYEWHNKKGFPDRAIRPVK